MELLNEVLTGRICPYCGKDTEYVDSAVIYGKSYGMMYLCRPCDAYVGVHKGSSVALGRLANKELRFWKKKAHEHFDKLWKEDNQRRSAAYKWLSEQMNLHPDLTHIGMMDVEQCKRVVQLCKKAVV